MKTDVSFLTIAYIDRLKGEEKYRAMEAGPLRQTSVTKPHSGGYYFDERLPSYLDNRKR